MWAGLTMFMVCVWEWGLLVYGVYMWAGPTCLWRVYAGEAHMFMVCMWAGHTCLWHVYVGGGSHSHHHFGFFDEILFGHGTFIDGLDGNPDVCSPFS